MEVVIERRTLDQVPWTVGLLVYILAMAGQYSTLVRRQPDLSLSLSLSLLTHSSDANF